jgi:hypothetical protein
LRIRLALILLKRQREGSKGGLKMLADGWRNVLGLRQ